MLAFLPRAIAARLGRWMRQRKVARLSAIHPAEARRQQKLLAVHIAGATPHRTIEGSLV